MADNYTNIRGNGQLREGSVFDINIASNAAISLSKLAHSVIRADGLTSFSGNQSMGSHRLTDLGTPIQFTDAASKDYVISMMASHTVQCATATDITLSGLPEIDGYQTVAEDRILVMGQEDPTENGIYVVMGSSAGFVRHDMMTSGKQANGVFVFVNNGSEFGGEGYICNSPKANIVGTDSISFRLFTGTYGEFEAGLEVWGANSVANAATIGGTENSSNYLGFYHDGSVGVIDSNAGDLVLESTSGFVGIMTLNPEYTLDVYGDINFSGDILKNGVSIGNSFTNYNPFVDVFTATANQTEFILTGTPINADKKWILVTQNGLPLSQSDYSLTEDGGIYTVTLTTGAIAGDKIEVRPFGLATIISTVVAEAGNLLVPNELIVGSSSVHITEGSIIGNDPNNVNGETLNIDVETGNLTVKGKVTCGSIEIGSGGIPLITTDATDQNTANKIVKRDANGDFSARNIGAASLTLSGDLTVNGTTTTVNTATLQVADNVVVLNKNEVGAGVTAGTSGIEIERGTSDNYFFQFRESDDSFVIGLAASLQVVATREDSPNDTGIPYWDNTSKSFKTRSDVKISSAGQVSAVTAKITGTPSTPAAAEIYAGSVDPTDTTRLNYNGYFYATRVYNAVWNDIAECMPSDGSLQPGEIAFVDLTVSQHRVTKINMCMRPDNFVGIVSENPGMIVGENDKYENKIYIVLRGMVWTSALGIFEKGTRLYYTPFGVKSKEDIIDSGINPLDIIYIGVVIEKNADKIRIFV